MPIKNVVSAMDSIPVSHLQKFFIAFIIYPFFVGFPALDDLRIRHKLALLGLGGCPTLFGIEIKKAL